MRSHFLLLLCGITLHAQSSPQQPPLTYLCHRAGHRISIDGKLDDASWQAADWTSDFVDIEGHAKPKPRFRTRAKLLWDDEYLYIAAELEEPDVSGTLTAHDSVIFHDNDFEVFLKPRPETESYFEFEINALNTSWDLFLPKPYNKGGKADDNWNIAELKTGVTIQGTLNRPENRDHGWTVEIAFPYAAYRSRQDVPNPHPGTEWRLNFSRVEWKYQTKDGKYVKLPGPEDNWVWSPQYVINMHVPERWGTLRFVQ